MTPEKKTLRNLIISGFILFLVIYIYQYAGERFVNSCKPVFFGIALAYVLNIMINWFMKHDLLNRLGLQKKTAVRRVLSTVFATVLLLALIAFVFVYVLPELTACLIALLDRVPAAIRFLLGQPFISKIIPAETLQTLNEIDWNNWINQVLTIIDRNDLFRSMTSTATSTLTAFSTLLFAIIFAVHFLIGREKRNLQIIRVIRAFLPDQAEKKFFRYMHILNDCLRAFIVCQFLQAVIMGVVSTILLLIFRFPYATMIGALSGFCALIPVVGGYVTAILGSLMILSDSPQMALFFLILIVVVQNVIGTFVFPRLVGNSLGLPAVWTLAAVTVGLGMFGIIGVFIGVPLTAFGYRCLAIAVQTREEKERLSAAKEGGGASDCEGAPDAASEERTGDGKAVPDQKPKAP